MNKDTITNIYRVFVLALLIWMVFLLDAIVHHIDYKNLSDAVRIQDVRIVKQENEAAPSNIQDVRIVNTLIPVSGEVNIRGALNAIPVQITNSPVPVKVITKDGLFNSDPVLVKVER